MPEHAGANGVGPPGIKLYLVQRDAIVRGDLNGEAVEDLHLQPGQHLCGRLTCQPTLAAMGHDACPLADSVKRVLRDPHAFRHAH